MPETESACTEPDPPAIDRPDPDDADLHRATWRFLRGLGCPADLADDLTQEALLRRLRTPWIGTRPEKTEARWLFTVARNLYRDAIRAGRVRRSVPWSNEVEASLATFLTTDHAHEQLLDCVAQLAPRAQEIVTLFYGHDLSRRAIAKRLNMQESGVKTALQRARALLKQCLGGSES